MAEIYGQQIDQLHEALQEDAERAKAADMFRPLVEQVMLMSDDREPAIILRGDLGAILRFAAGKRDPYFLAEAEALDNLLSQASLVAGNRSRRTQRYASGNAKTFAAEPAEQSQVSLVAGVGFGLWRTFPVVVSQR